MNGDSQRPTTPPAPVPEEPEEERPTLIPEFDLAEFARQKMTIGTPTTVPVTTAPLISSASSELAEFFLSGDFETTLALCDALLQQDPTDPEARKYAELSKRELSVTYLAAFGGTGAAVPRRKGPVTRIDGNPAAVFAAVDGRRSIDEIVRFTRQERLSVLSVLYDLLERGALEF